MARESGARNFSLEAVAARAGVSKGGLLYHFPSKALLMEALIESHLARDEALMAACRARLGPVPNTAAIALIDAFRHETRNYPNPPSDVLAAIGEAPRLLEPLRRSHRQTADRLWQESEDPEAATIAFLAIQGLHLLRLFESNCLDEDRREAVLLRLEAVLSRDERGKFEAADIVRGDRLHRQDQ